MVEVDASTLGVGAVLSQWKGEPPVLHPCAYFSRKLSPAEQNYDIGDRELLAIKLALEEWRHWLEGAQHPFEVITDHKNLQYLRDARRLNPRQARWALFFTRFRFTVTYRPGHKNLKADALSRLHQPDPFPECPEPILSPTVFVCPIEWALDDQIRAATLDEPAPLGGPEGKSFVPTALRLAPLDSVHSSPGSGHPGSQRTLSLLRNRYWWPNMARDVARYVKGCSVCSIASTPRRLPEGKLVPLPILRRPWSHLGIDFATDLPSSNGFTTILVVIDRFSKACKLIPLRGLPTALETAEALFQYIFRNFGIPEDIVSDRGPQFISRVWHAFFRLLGVTVSLSSGYHPQSNGQTERKIQEIGRYLRAYCHEHQDSWSQYLPWLSTLKIPCDRKQQVWHLSSAYLDINLHSSRGPENPLKSLQLTIGSVRARGYGTQHTSIFSRQFGDIRSMPMSVAPQPRCTDQETKSGSPHGTSVSGCPAKSWVPVTSVLFPS